MYTLSLTVSIDGGTWSTPGRVRFTQWKEMLYLLCMLGELQNQSEWEWKNLSPIVIRSPDRPTCDESLCRLHCPGPHIINPLSPELNPIC
jgi:hypothetical protein